MKQVARQIGKQSVIYWLVGGLLLLFGWTWLAVPGPVRAHALLVRSSPEANANLPQTPDQIDLWFSEPLEDGFNQIRLLTSTGQEIPLGPVKLDSVDPTHLIVSPEVLEPGIYTLAWQNLSRVDGHEWSGSFPFTILNPDGSRPVAANPLVADAERGELPSPADILARWLGLLGGMLLFGISLFQLFVVPQARQDNIQSHLQSLVLRMVWIGALAVVFGAWLQLLLQSYRLGGLEQLPDLLLFTRSGVLVLIRQVMALTGLLIILSLPQPSPLRDAEWRFFTQLITGSLAVSLLFLLTITQIGWVEMLLTIALCILALVMAGLALLRKAKVNEQQLWQPLLLLAATLLLTFSLSSHAGAVPGSNWAIAVDYVHLLAAATWVGGLLLLPMLGWQIYLSATGSEQFFRLVRQFSYLAALSVFVLIATGLLSSLVQLPTLASLWQTAYGRVLLLKLLLIGLALPIAFWNNRLVRQRDNVTGQTKRFNGLVTIEALICMGIIISVAILVQTSAPRSLDFVGTASTTGTAYNEIVTADDLNIHLQIMPGHVGQNTFIVHLYHDDNSAVGDIQLVRLFFNYQETEIGRASADLQESSQNNIFNTAGAYLNQSGLWELTVYVRRRGMDDVLAEYLVTVSPPNETVTTNANPWQNPFW